MRVPAQSVSHLGMLIDHYLPDCALVKIDAVDVEREAAEIWQALPDLWNRLKPPGLFSFLLWFAALMRGDPFRRRPAASAHAPLTLREGQPVPFPGDPYDSGSLLIVGVDEGRELVVRGNHRYSDYFANIYLEPLAAGRTRVYNVTRADFSSSLLGRIYVQGVRLFHDPIVQSGLARLKRFVEEAPTMT